MARIARAWAVDLENTCDLACGAKSVPDLPTFTEKLDIPVNKYFERFRLCFGPPSSWFDAHLLLEHYLDPALRIDMVDIGLDFQAAKEYLIHRFKKVPTCPVPVFITDPQSNDQLLANKESESSQDWYDPTLMKPCPLQGHGHHEVGTCVDFFFSFAERPQGCYSLSHLHHLS